MQDWTTTFGNESDPTVLLLHRVGWTRHAWTPHAEGLADRYRAVTIDLPGHGIHPDPEFTMERAVADVREALDEAGSAVLVGHSLGGFVAIRAAAAHPDRVDGLLLAGADTNWRSPIGTVYSSLLYLTASLVGASSSSSRLSRWVHLLFRNEPELVAGPNDEAQRPPSDEDAHPYPRAFASAIREIVYRPTWPDVEAYGGPTLLVHGTEEGLPEHAGKLAARAKANLRWIDGDHYAPMEATETFTAEVARFLDEVYGG
jgi:pimeloyl-ACP methyl ester carboxylesterase